MIEKALQGHRASKCELCAASSVLSSYIVPPPENGIDHSIMLCETCLLQINDPEAMDVNHWRCLNDSMWSQVPAVQVIAWRMLTRLGSTEVWAAELLDTLYLEDEIRAWAELGVDVSHDDTVKHVDSNGVVLATGDSVTLIKDLNVKGTTFTAKRGTAVRKIALVHDNPQHIEGRVNGQQIVILTKFVKKNT